MSTSKRKTKTRQRPSRGIILPAINESFSPTVRLTSRNMENLLTKSLAAYVLLRSREPVSVVMRDLFKIENEAATLVTEFCGDQERIASVRGTLASVFSLVPIGQRSSVKDATPIKLNLPLNSKKLKKSAQKNKKNG